MKGLFYFASSVHANAMKNIALRLSFDGTAYHGWQIQKNAASVCAALQSAVAKTVGAPVTLHGCGRTDAGVHARVYVANFRADTNIPVARLPYALAARLPGDIVVTDAAEAPGDFDAIGSCLRKEYTYYIRPGVFPDPLLRSRVLHYPFPVELAKWQAAAAEFVGTHDFACVRTMGTPVKSTVRTLYEFEVFGEGGLVAFRMSADGFLYNMARALVGSVLCAGQGKIDSIGRLLDSKDRARGGPVLPPHGLYMTGVSYGEVLPWG